MTLLCVYLMAAFGLNLDRRLRRADVDWSGCFLRDRAYIAGILR